MSNKNLGEKHISNNELKGVENNHSHEHKHGSTECNCGHHHGESKIINTEKNHNSANEHNHEEDDSGGDPSNATKKGDCSQNQDKVAEGINHKHDENCACNHNPKNISEHDHNHHHHHHHKHDESCSCTGHNSSHKSIYSSNTGGSIPQDLKDKAQSFVVSGVD